MLLSRIRNIIGLHISPLAGNNAHQVFDESYKDIISVYLKYKFLLGCM